MLRTELYCLIFSLVELYLFDENFEALTFCCKDKDDDRAPVGLRPLRCWRDPIFPVTLLEFELERLGAL